MSTTRSTAKAAPVKPLIRPKDPRPRAPAAHKAPATKAREGCVVWAGAPSGALGWTTLVWAVAPRVAREELTVGDYHIPAGTLLTLSTSAANHDPAAHDQPERFDISAARREPPLTFGGGAHYCLGANLARAEMQEALAILARRLRDVRLDGDVTWRPRTGIFGPTRLPVRFVPG